LTPTATCTRLAAVAAAEPASSARATRAPAIMTITPGNKTRIGGMPAAQCNRLATRVKGQTGEFAGAQGRGVAEASRRCVDPDIDVAVDVVFYPSQLCVEREAQAGLVPAR